MKKLLLLLIIGCSKSGSSFDNKDLGLNGTYTFRDNTIVIANSMFFYKSPGCEASGEMLGYSVRYHYVITGKEHIGCSWMPKTMDCGIRLNGNELDVYCPDAGISAVYEAN